MPQYRIPRPIAVGTLAGLNGQPDQTVPIDLGNQPAENSLTRSTGPSPTGPYQSMEELYKQAYAQPQRVKTPRFSPSVDDPSLGYEMEDVIQPGWQKNAALDGLKHLQQTQYGTDQNPLGEVADRRRLEEIRGAQDEASLSGFDRPQDAAMYARRIAEEKMRQPIEQQRMIGQTQRDVAQTQGQNAIEVERERQRGGLAVQDRYNEVLKMLQGGGDGGNPIAGATLPGQRGGGSVRFDTNPTAPQQIPPTLKRDVQNAFAEVTRRPNPRSDASYKMAVVGVLQHALQAGQIDFNVFEAAQQVLSDPDLRSRDIEELVEAVEFDAGDSPEDQARQMQQFRMAIMLGRGQ